MSATAAAATVEIFDADFKHVIDVPADAISHYPPQRLNITRLVVCRNYVPHVPHSCSMAASCKFVHVDADVATMPHQPIHVNYAWRSEDLVTYPRLAAGEVLTVMAPNNRPPTEEVRSEHVLVTRGSLMRKEHAGPLSHCAHYYFNRMCNRGERCNFIHVVHIDPTVQGNFKRAPTRSAVQRHAAAATAPTLPQFEAAATSVRAADDTASSHDGSCGHLSESGDVQPYAHKSAQRPAVRYYRHNPYSLQHVTVWC